MANLFFNNLTITADRATLDEIRRFVDADVLWAAEEVLDESAITESGDELRYRYDSKHGIFIQSAEMLARRFPQARVVFTFRNANESVYGFAEYENGKEVRGNVFEDCGGY